MRKHYILWAALLLAGSCQKAELEPAAPQQHIRTFTATFSELTRTSLGDGLTPLWGAGDAVWFSDGVNQEVVGVEAQYNGQATAQFTTTSLTGETVYALYPAAYAIYPTTEQGVHFEIPAHADGSFQRANICVSVTEDDKLSFKNATALIRFTQSTADVVSLSLVRPDENVLAGWMYFRPWDGYTLGSLHKTVSSIEVDMDGPGTYYASVYPQTLPAGSKIVMTTRDGQHYVRTINAANSFTVNNIKTISVDAAISGATLVPNDGWAGSGTAEDPYLIVDGEGLKRLAENVNSQVDYYTNKHFKLVSDISVSNYRPVGSTNKGNGFQGYFDGCHHTVTIESFDLSYLSSQSANSYEVYMGLFGWVSGSASLSEPTRVIQNVRVAGKIDTGNDFLRGPHYYGSICARATGNLKLERCGSALNMRLFGYYANNSSWAKLQAAGGVVGYAAADVQIQRCWNTGSLAAYSNANSGNRFYVGGICGNLYGGLVRLCYNTGNITAQMTQLGYGAFVAGIAASNTTTGKVEGSYNQGKIIAYGASSTSAKAVGITYNAQAMYCYNSGVIKSYYAGSSTTETAYSAGISYRQSGTYQHCFYLQGTASTDFLGSGGTITDCNYFTRGEYADGGVVGGDPTKPLLNALNGYEATAQNFMPHFLPSPVSPFLPVLSYVSRNILNY